MKHSLRHLLALPPALAVMAGLGCDSSSSYGDRDTDPPQAEIETEAQAPGWVSNVAVAKADITVTGMTWGGCEAAVRSSLADLDGVEDVLIDLATGQVTVKLADDAVLTQAQVAQCLTNDHNEKFKVTAFTLAEAQPATPE